MSAVANRILTTGDLRQMFPGLSYDQARVAVDSLGAKRIKRIGRFRVLPESMLGEFREELRRRGWLAEED